MSLYVKLQAQEQHPNTYVEIDTNNFPPTHDLVDLLGLEAADIRLWHRCVIELFQEGREHDAQQLIDKVIHHERETLNLGKGRWDFKNRVLEGIPDDRIRFFNAAALAQINRDVAAPTATVSDGMEFKKKAQSLLELADKIYSYDHPNGSGRSHNSAASTWIGKALFGWVAHDQPRTMQYFDFSERQTNNVGVHIAKGCYYYATSDYENALSEFLKALSMVPTCPPTVHVGIGICCLKLGEFDIALQAFRRGKKLGSDLQDKYAMVTSCLGAALVYLNREEWTDADCHIYRQYQTNRKQLEEQLASNQDLKAKIRAEKKKMDTIRKALELLREAAEIDPTNPQLLTLLSTYVGFCLDDWSYVMKMGGTAYEYCQNVTGLSNLREEHSFQHGIDMKRSAPKHPFAQCQAECCYVLGKMYHVQNDYAHATQWYEEAITLSPNFSLALFGLAQMYHFQGKDVGSIQCLRQVHAQFPSHVPTLKLLGHLQYTKDGSSNADKQEAKRLLAKATTLNPQDIDAWMEFATVNEVLDPDEALKAYKKAEKLYREDNRKVPVELYNNIVVVLYKLGQFESAQRYCEQLLQNSSTSEEITRKYIPLWFNYGRIQDALGDFKGAKKSYLTALKGDPKMVECYRCLAQHSMRQGHQIAGRQLIHKAFKEAQAAVQEAEQKGNVEEQKQYQDLEIDASLDLARVYLDGGRAMDCKKLLKMCSSKYDDEYANVALGNLLLRTRQKNQEVKKIIEAAKLYQKALSENENNHFAILGMSVCLAELGELDRAKSRLKSLHDERNNPDVSVNLGHIEFFHKNYDSAVKHYEKALRRLPMTEHGDIPMFLAQAQFGARNYDGCKETLLKAMRLQPREPIWQFNLALNEESFGVQTLQKKAKTRTSQDVQKAVESLDCASRLFRRLDRSENKLPKPKCKAHHEYCKKSHENGLQHARHHRAKEEKEKETALANKQQLREEEERLNEEYRRQEEKRRREKQKEQRRARQRREEAKVIQEKFGQAALSLKKRNLDNAEERIAKRRRVGKNADKPNDFNDDYNNVDNQATPMDYDDEDTYGAVDIQSQMQQKYDEALNEDNDAAMDDAFGDGDGDAEMADIEPPPGAGEYGDAEGSERKKKKKKKKDKKVTDWAPDELEYQTQLKARIRQILEDANAKENGLQDLTHKQVRMKLSEEFGLNKKRWKSWIKEQINELVREITEMGEGEE